MCELDVDVRKSAGADGITGARITDVVRHPPRVAVNVALFFPDLRQCGGVAD
jgi:hypothetical protein